MALTYSSMLTLGKSLPSFSLLNTLDNKLYNSKVLLNGKPSLLMVICNHCPYVIHYHNEIQNLYQEYNEILNFVAVSSNDIEKYPEDNPMKMKELFNSLSLEFPYLYDETQSLAKELKAECTPEFYLYDKNQKLVYRGRMDNSSPGNNEKITGKDIRNAIVTIQLNRQTDTNQFPSMGCNIKWKNY